MPSGLWKSNSSLRIISTVIFNFKFLSDENMLNFESRFVSLPSTDKKHLKTALAAINLFLFLVVSKIDKEKRALFVTDYVRA